MSNQSFLMGILSVFTVMSLSAQADTSKVNFEPTLLAQTASDNHMDSNANDSTVLKLKQSSSSIQLYGTLDIGYEYRK